MVYQRNSKILPLIEMVWTENQRLHIELGNSANEKELLKQKLVELRSQLETECANREETEAELFELKQNSAPAATLSEKLTPDAATILSQLARQAQKIPGVTCRHRDNFGDYRGVLREHIPGTLGINPGSFRGFPGQNLNNCRLTKSLGTCDRG